MSWPFGIAIVCGLLANLYFFRAALHLAPGVSKITVLLWERFAPRERYTAEGWRLRQIAMRWVIAAVLFAAGKGKHIASNGIACRHFSTEASSLMICQEWLSGL